MRLKKNYYVLTFRTTTEALSMESKCLEKGIPGRLIPTPGEITAGCGLAWRMLSSDYEMSENTVRELGIQFENIVRLLI